MLVAVSSVDSVSTGSVKVGADVAMFDVVSA
jgi:hypothetical protein